MLFKYITNMSNISNMANIEWKSLLETLEDTDLNIDLLNNGTELQEGKRYSFYSLTRPNGPKGKQFQKITGTFFQLNPAGEAVFSECVDEHDNALTGDRIGFRKFKLVGSDILSTKEDGVEMTHLAKNPGDPPDYSDKRPYGGTKKRRRYGKQKTKRRRKTTRRRKLNRKRKPKR